MHFLEWNYLNPIEISLKFVPKGPNNNVPAFVHIMAWRRIGDKPLSEQMLTWFTDAYMRHYGGGGGELTRVVNDIPLCLHIPAAFPLYLASWALFQYPIKRLIVRSRKVSKPRYLYLELFDGSEIETTNIPASILYEILWFSDIKTGPSRYLRH